MSDLRHPDLEIYIKSRSSEQVIQWLEQVCDSVQVLTQTATSCELELEFCDQYTSASLQQKVSGKAWSSLWFKSNPTPWDTDLDCALLASEQMATQIRCIKAGWEDNQENDESGEQWWRVEDNEKQLIDWKG
ncbi:hypothetical protein A9R01_15045 ['Osedax' symbiont bacterium Rs2_46_30_T18]|nr:hypothetical protein A9R01_15045 ['Osedax' symbiont bacterium Rs2_46_30_T18]